MLFDVAVSLSNFNKWTKKIIRSARLSPSPPWYAQYIFQNRTQQIIIHNIIIICAINAADIKAHSNNLNY